MILKMINKNSIEYTEALWGLQMARMWMENHWKHLGPKYDLSYNQRVKEANWHLDWALSWLCKL